MDSPDELLIASKAWQSRLGKLVPPASLGERASLQPAREALFHIERRLGEGTAVPPRVAVFGPTGSGKSKLFNSLIGEAVSPASYKRPFTRRPLYYLHHRRAPSLKPLRGDVRLHRREEWAGLVLIDTPDFDSVEAENRAAAAQVYLEADAFIFVADVHKYADAAVWEQLSRIRAEGKRSVFILNKTAPASEAAPSEAAAREAAPGESPFDDFQARLAKAFHPQALPGPVLAIAYHPQADEDLLPRESSGLAALRGWLDRLPDPSQGGGRALLAESLRIDLERFLRSWDASSRLCSEYRSGIRRLGRDLEARHDRIAAALAGDVEARVDPALSGVVYREVLRRIERMDLLRYPRRLLALPVLGLKKALGRFWPGRDDPRGAGAPAEETASDAANLATLERRVQDFSEETRQAMRGEPACPGVLDDETYRALRLDHQAVRERYRAAASEFRAWAEDKARSTAAILTSEHKVKFVLSQLIYNTVVIGVQVKTAGTLTLAEMLTDGILSPLVAKAVGMALSSERVKEFEEEARREHGRRLLAVLREARERFAGHLAEAEEGLRELDALAPEVEALRAVRVRLVDRWQRGGSR